MTTNDAGLTPLAIAARLQDGPFAAAAAAYRAALDANALKLRHGDAPRWLAAIAALPVVDGARVQLDADAPGAAFDLGADATATLVASLQQLAPWRKGPFRIGPVDIDTEWRSDWKWQRIAAAMSPLAGRRVIDIGGGNGYFAWRCAGHGAAAVLNVDPTLLFYMQYLAIDRYLRCSAVAMLPLTFEALPMTQPFDTALSMGVLYHRRSPLEHLEGIASHLRPGGELVLETLVVDGDASTVLVPDGRYAGMRNVWSLPSVAMLSTWLERSGFSAVRLVDETVTSTDEQRPTAWMTFHSLAHALDPADPTRTIEGHPAPKRAVLIAQREA